MRNPQERQSQQPQSAEQRKTKKKKKRKHSFDSAFSIGKLPASSGWTDVDNWTARRLNRSAAQRVRRETHLANLPSTSNEAQEAPVALRCFKLRPGGHGGCSGQTIGSSS